jgi:uncharacterized integral membrane protein
MRTVVEVLMTVVAMALLLGIVVSLPFIVIFIIIGITGYLTYATIHDARLAQKEERQISDDSEQ